MVISYRNVFWHKQTHNCIFAVSLAYVTSTQAKLEECKTQMEVLLMFPLNHPFCMHSMRCVCFLWVKCVAILIEYFIQMCLFFFLFNNFVSYQEQDDWLFFSVLKSGVVWHLHISQRFLLWMRNQCSESKPSVREIKNLLVCYWRERQST